MKNIFTLGIIALVVLGGGYVLTNRDSGPVVTEIPTSEESSISALLEVSPEQPKAGEQTTINFFFTNADGSAVGDLMVHHARRVHTLILSEDLSSIGHIHPQDFSEINDAVIQSGRYSVTYTFPRAGRYIIGVDVMSREDTLAKQFIIDVKGKPKMREVATKDLRQEKCFKGYPEDGEDRYVRPVFISEAEVECPTGYKVTLSPSVDTVTAGEEMRLQYRFEKDGDPVADLEPFLDAAIHFAIVPASLDTLLHTHGVIVGMGHHEEEDEYMVEGEEHEEGMGMEDAIDDGGMEGMDDESLPDEFGPDLVSETLIFPKAGLYQVFVQAQHNGQIIFANFMIQVEEGFDEATAQIFDLAVENQSLSPKIVTVEQDDKVIFRVSTDEAGEFHIAGYGIEKDMELGKTTEIRFTANIAGRYNLELHPEAVGEEEEDDIIIGALVVNPR